MTLSTHEFIRRFLIHVLTAGFHRIRHYGLFANHSRVKQVQRLRELLSDDTLDAVVATDTVDDHLPTATYTCQACGAPMIHFSLTWHVHRQHCTGSAALLPKLGNLPTSNSLMASTLPHTCPLMNHIKASDPHRNRREQVNSRNNSSNPHSAVATNEPMSPRPRGFLP